MKVDGSTNMGPEARQAPPGSAGLGSPGLNRRPAPPLDESDPEAEERFKKSIADLSRRLGERAAKQAEIDPKAEVEARRAAVRAYFSTRARRLKTALGAAGAAIGAAAIAWLVVMIAAPSGPPSADATASKERTSPLETAAAAPVPSLPPSIQPVPEPPSPSSGASAASAVPPAPAKVDPVLVDPAPAVKREPTPVAPRSAGPSAPPPPTSASSVQPIQPVVATAPPPSGPATASDSAPATTAPSDLGQSSPPMRSDEVREVQGRLRSFGFNPGPVDGTPGPMTEAAIMHYQENRRLPQTGQVDRDLLEQLRQDPAPQVPVRPDPPPRPRYYARSSDPFAPLQQIGDSINRWFQSIGR